MHRYGSSMAMKYKIEYISTFHADILLVNEILAEYTRKASRIFAKMDKAIANLQDMPEMYPRYPDAPSYHYIVVEDYLVFYKVKKQARLVEIRRLIYSRMDIPALMQE